jgi:hypothetical protein
MILKKRETTPSVQASNAGGWHSDREIAVWGGPHITWTPPNTAFREAKGKTVLRQAVGL